MGHLRVKYQETQSQPILRIERERERRKKWGTSERHYILGGIRKKETIFPVLKVPRQCPLVLLVEAAHMIGIRFIIIIIVRTIRNT
jgi:hypothetical protein